MLYQLGKYNTDENLTPQSKEIRDHLISKQDFISIFDLIKNYQYLEIESIKILKLAINAGYWNSEYGFNWNSNQEIQFWETVNQKSNYTISKLQLLRTKQISGKESIQSLKADYIEILNNEPQLYYELISEDLDNIWQNDKDLKMACLIAMFICVSKDMSTNEFDEYVLFHTKKHFLNEETPIQIIEIINKIKKDKAGNNALDGQTP
ncbi:MAG TPA: hypothetical protein PKD51_02765 [Saprospiraceae bacterium]|nr:hypothetical protein [Saprospiraceae bacterium]